MIALRIKNTWLNLFPKTSLNITINNPLFDTESIERVFSYPFKLPASPTNLQALTHVNRLDVELDDYKLEAELWIDGVMFEEGILVIQSTTQKIINAVFKNNTMSIFEDLATIKTSDVALPTVNFENNYEPYSHFELLASNISTQTKIAIQINGQLFEEDLVNFGFFISLINNEFPGLVEEIGPPSSDHFIRIKKSEPGDLIKIGIRPGFLDPAVYAFFDYKTPFNSTYNSSVEDVRNDWINYLANHLSNTENTFTFPVINFPNFYFDSIDPKSDTFLGYANNYSNDDYIIYDENSTTGEFKNTMIPMVFIKTILDKLSEHSDRFSGFGGDIYNDPEIQQLLIYNNRSLDYNYDYFDFHEILNDPNPYTGPRTLYYWKDGFDLNDHVPEIPADEFLKNLAKTFCAFFIFRSGRLHIISRKSILNTIVEDWTELSEPDYTQSLASNEGYEIDYDRQDDESNPPIFEKIRVGDGKTLVEIPFYTFDTPLDIDTDSTPPKSWFLPLIEEKGYSDLFKIYESYSLRLLFFRGLQNDSNGDTYPLATYSDKNYDGDEVGNYSLAIQGEKGLHQVWWKGFLELVSNGKEIEKIVRLDIQTLLKEKEFKNPRKRIFHPQGQMVGVIKSIQIKATTSGLSLAKVKFITQ